MQITAAIYARVSTKEQAEGKASIPDQLELGERVTHEHKWGFYKKYVDAGISGHLTAERAGLQELLRDARAHKFNLVVVKDFDRLARNRSRITIIREELKELGIQTYAITTPVEPKDPQDYDPDEDDASVIIEGMSDINADLERKKIMRRMKMGKMNKAKNGFIPNRVPYGYKIQREIDEHAKIKRTVLVDEEAAMVIQKIFNLYNSGIGIQKVAITLNNEKHQSPQGGLWSAPSVKYILKNPTYTGKVWWGWRHADYKKTKDRRIRGKEGIIEDSKQHEAIITPDVFDKAQLIQKQRGQFAKGGAARSFGLLTGLLKCIRCGKGGGYKKRYHTRSKQNPNWNDTITHEYICTGYKYYGICSARIMSADKLENSVIDQIRNIYNHPKVQKQIVYKGNERTQRKFEKELQKLTLERTRVPQRMQRQQEAFEANVSTVEEYGQALQRLRDDEKRIDDEINRIKSYILQVNQNADTLQKFAATLKNFDKLWPKLTLDEKKHILRTIIKQIRAGDGRVEIDFVL